MSIIKTLSDSIRQLPAGKTERSYYAALQDFFKQYFESTDSQAEIQAIAEESSGKVGFPDITLRNKGRLMGWIEVKLPEDDLNNTKFQAQFDKYKTSLENLIFTNLRQWQLWQWNQDGISIKIDEITCDILTCSTEEEHRLNALLNAFAQGHVYDARTAKQLALALARKTRLLSQQVEQALGHSDGDSELHKLKQTFSNTLIQNITNHQFANLVAETLAYSLFLASLEHYEKQENSELTLTTAIDYLPRNVPILRDLFDLIKRVSEPLPGIKRAIITLIDQLQAANLGHIRHTLIDHKVNEDPVIQFYEPFLKEYDPKEREARGVYYTPKPVVDFIVRSVDSLLNSHFGKKQGLADHSVHILDPATGTGTFLMVAIQRVHQRIKQQYEPLNMHVDKFNETVHNHILQHFYGFELLVAPYAIAHLKLTLETQRLGGKLDDANRNRFQVFLANTLDDPKKPPIKDWVGFPAIPKESESAQEIKNQQPILAIIGNPPYSASSQNPSQIGRKNTWIGDLVESYKTELREKNLNAIQNDYVKFIRFSQWKITQSGQGIFAMITANSFLDGITHRRMRESLLHTFDEIYIYNLHGDSRKGETTPEGNKDENVFDIQTGVSINVFIKKNQAEPHCRLYSADAWGSRKTKFVDLEKDFAEVSWQEIDYRGFNASFLKTRWSKFLGALNYFVPSASDAHTKMTEYGQYWGIQDIFHAQGSGIKFRKDNLLIKNHFSKSSVASMISDMVSKSPSYLFNTYNFAETADWQLESQRSHFIPNDTKNIQAVEYRPFDIRYTYYPYDRISKIIPRGDSRSSLMRHMLKPNLGLVTKRGMDFSTLALITKNFIDMRTFSNPGVIGTDYLFPLLTYPPEAEKDLPLEHLQKANLLPKYTTALTQALGSTPEPQTVLYYIYALLYCPSYRQRYSEQLKIDFPRIPLTTNATLFAQLAQQGNMLVNLHMLGDNPFDDNASALFADTASWGVRVDGKSPQSTENWKVEKVSYDSVNQRVYVNAGQYFEGIEPDTWNFMIGGYQVLGKWLKDRQKAKRCLSTDDLTHYMKVVHSLRQTQKIMQDIDDMIPAWPLT